MIGWLKSALYCDCLKEGAILARIAHNAQLGMRFVLKSHSCEPTRQIAGNTIDFKMNIIMV
jgi:hypothetical protein